MAFNPIIPKWNTKTKANGTLMSASLQQAEDNDNYLLGLTSTLSTDMYESDQALQGEIDDLNEEITALSIDDQYSVFTASSTGAYSFKIATAMKTNVPTTYSTILNYEIITNYLGRITGAWGMRSHTVYVNVFQIDDLYTDVTMNKTFLYEFADRWELWGLTTNNFSGAMVIRPANNLSVSTSLHKNVWVFPGKVSNESSPSAYSEANPTGYTGRNFIDYTSSSYDDRRVSTWSAESTDDHKAMCSIGDVPGYLQNKLVGSDWLDVTEIPLNADEKNIKFALKDPDFFVKGTTNYGGTLLPATTGDFNSPVHDGYFTGYYNTLNSPPVQPGNPSWFVHHMNSNAGTAYAVQIAYAYTSTIICYERTKVDGVWQPWSLRSAGSTIIPEYNIYGNDWITASKSELIDNTYTFTVDTSTQFNNSANNWNNTYDDLSSNSAIWNNKLDKTSADTLYQSIGSYLSTSSLDSLSANWESTYNTVNSNSANWESHSISGNFVNYYPTDTAYVTGISVVSALPLTLDEQLLYIVRY